MVVWKDGVSPRAIKLNNRNAVSLDDKTLLKKIHARTGDHSGRALFLSNTHYVEESVLPEAIPATICRSLGVNLPIMDAPALTQKICEK